MFPETDLKKITAPTPKMKHVRSRVIMRKGQPQTETPEENSQVSDRVKLTGQRKNKDKAKSNKAKKETGNYYIMHKRHINTK